jgi:hypothetical protein
MAGTTWIATPIDTTNLNGRKITQVAAGEQFSLLLADDGSVFSFELDLTLPAQGASRRRSTPTNLGGRKNENALPSSARSRRLMIFNANGTAITERRTS